MVPGPLIKKKYKRIFVILIILIMFLYIFYKVDRDLKPTMMAYCDSMARIIAIQTINITIREEFQNKISYDDLINIKTDKDGNIVMIQANTVELNRIGSEIALSVQDKIQGLGVTGVKIPLGILLKNDLFAFYGPQVKFKMQPFGTVITSYRSEFQSAGINQTRHIIYLDVTANLFVVIPIARNSVTITTNVPIAESIIVGKVPTTVVNLGDGISGSNIKTNELQNTN